jgi:hypothetical protein
MGEVKRGFRKVTLVLPVKDYEALMRQSEMNDREPGQQAAFLLKRALAPQQGQSLVDELDDRANGTLNEMPLLEPEIPAEVE